MKPKSRLDSFLSETNYVLPVDIKKLRFIFSAIELYASSRKKDIENLRVFEIGCGMGGITFPLASLGCQVRAIDVDQDCIEYVQSQIDRNEISNLVVSVDDGCRFDDGTTYDVVVVSEVFEHVLEPSELAASILRRMAEGAYLIVTIPNGYGPWEVGNRVNPRTYLRRWNWLRRQSGRPTFVEGDGKYHCQYFSKRRFLELMSEFSLTLVDSGNSDAFLTVLRPWYEKSDLLGNIDIKLADLLPHTFASGWYFVFELDKG
jgi:SAM-dependent methyltransferase